LQDSSDRQARDKVHSEAGDALRAQQRNDLRGDTRRDALSTAERWALVLALIAVLLQGLGAAEALEYRRTLLASEPWRLLSGHFVHLNWPHLAVNAVALVIVARLFAPDLPARRQLAVLAAATLAIGAGLAFAYPGIVWYRGLSGVIHALFFAGAVTWLLAARPRTLRVLWLPAALVVGGWIKVMTEQPHGEALPYADWLSAAVVPQAHLLGAACGSLAGLAFALADGLSAASRRQQ
jgi:rhomboid family GlyGly-CTERM serine protease